MAGAQGAPISIVSGLPRSGTSLMMQILGAAGMPLLYDRQRLPDASNPCGYFELEAVKRTRTDPSWVDGAGGCAVKVIHALLSDLPRRRRYRVIWMERPLGQVVASQNAMLARLGRADPGGLSDEELRCAFAVQSRRARALLDEVDCFAWMPVSYVDLVRDPLRLLPGLLDFLCIEASLDALAACVRPELHRSR